MQEPLISLIIPVYNVETYMAACLESAVRQTFPRLEIICVDDCGTDASVSIVREFAARDKRIKLIRNPQNKGLAGSRNVGIHNSSAPFIMFLDSDDTYDLSMCEKMYQAIMSSAADAAICGVRISYECNDEHKQGDEEYYALKFTGKHRVTDTLLAACDVSAWNKIYRRELLERYAVQFPEGLKYEDAYFFNAYMAHAESMMFVNEKLYHYRRRAGSIMNQTFAKASGMSIDHVKIAIALHQHYRQWGLAEKKYDYFCRFFVQCVDFSLWHSSSPQDEADILRLSRDFVRRYLNTAPHGAEVAARIEQLKRYYPLSHKGHFLRVKSKTGSVRYYFLGIPVYKVKYARRYSKHYICGLPLWRKRF